MAFEIPIGTYESLRTRRRRELTLHEALVGTALPAVRDPGSLEAKHARDAIASFSVPERTPATSKYRAAIAETMRASLSRPEEDDGGNLLTDILGVLDKPRGAVVSTLQGRGPGAGWSDPGSAQGRDLPLVDLLSDEDIAFGISPRDAGGAVADAALDPITWATVGAGGAAGAALRKGGGLAGRALANVVEPAVSGSWRRRAAAEIAANLGARTAAGAVDEVLPEDTNGWVRAGLQLVAGAAGGVAAVQAVRPGVAGAPRAANALGDDAAMREAAPEAFEAGRGRYDDALFPRARVAGGAPTPDEVGRRIPAAEAFALTRRLSAGEQLTAQELADLKVTLAHLDANPDQAAAPSAPAPDTGARVADLRRRRASIPDEIKALEAERRTAMDGVPYSVGSDAYDSEWRTTYRNLPQSQQITALYDEAKQVDAALVNDAATRDPRIRARVDALQARVDALEPQVRDHPGQPFTENIAASGMSPSMWFSTPAYKEYNRLAGELRDLQGALRRADEAGAGGIDDLSRSEYRRLLESEALQDRGLGSRDVRTGAGAQFLERFRSIYEPEREQELLRTLAGEYGDDLIRIRERQAGDLDAVGRYSPLTTEVDNLTREIDAMAGEMRRNGQTPEASEQYNILIDRKRMAYEEARRILEDRAVELGYPAKDYDDIGGRLAGYKTQIAQTEAQLRLAEERLAEFGGRVQDPDAARRARLARLEQELAQQQDEVADAQRRQQDAVRAVDGAESPRERADLVAAAKRAADDRVAAESAVARTQRAIQSEATAAVAAQAPVVPPTTHPVSGGALGMAQSPILNPQRIPAVAALQQAPLSTGMMNATLRYADPLNGKAPGVPSEIARSYALAHAQVQADKAGAVRQLAERVPGLGWLMRKDRPPLPDHILEAWIASDSARAEASNVMLGTERQHTVDLTTQFAAKPKAVAPADAFTIEVNGQKYRYPGADAFPDYAERPALYDLTPEQKRALQDYDARNDEWRKIGNDGYGTEIGMHRPPDGGTYIRHIDRSPEAERLRKLDMAPESSSATRAAAQERLFPTGFDRWANDMQKWGKGEITREQVFTPETDIALLVREADDAKLNAIHGEVFRAGLGGKTLEQVVEEYDPRLIKAKEAAGKRVASLQRRVATAIEALKVDTAVSDRLYTRLGRLSKREAELMGRRIRAEGGQRFDAVAGNLPPQEWSTARIEVAKQRLTLGADGQPTKTKANDAILDQIGELQALEDIRASLDAAGGDIGKAISYLERDADRFGREITLRADAGARASAQNVYARGWRGRATAGMQNPYDRVIAEGSGGEPYRQVVRRSDTIMNVLRGLWDTGTAEVQLTQMPAIEKIDAQIAEVERTIRALTDAAEGPSVRAIEGVVKLDKLRTDLSDAKTAHKDLRTAYEGASPRDYKQVRNGVYKFFKADEAAALTNLMRTSRNPIVRLTNALNATVLSADTSPVTGVQSPLAFMFDPVTSYKAWAQAAERHGGWSAIFSPDAIAADVRRDPGSWGDFAFDTGRSVREGTPQEFAGGLVGEIGYKDIGARFQDLNRRLYSAVTWLQKGLYDRARQDLLDAGFSVEDARAAAGDMANKMIPQINTRRMGQSSAQAELQRMPFTSLSFIRQPAALVGEATKGYAKIIAAQSMDTLTAKERLAVRAMNNFAGTTTALSVTTAVLNALAQGDDPIAAAGDAVNPMSSKFMAITLPGTDQRIPLGGPFRGLIRAIAPRMVPVAGLDARVPVPFASIASYFGNRIQPTLRRQVDLVRNRTWDGDKIMTADAPLNVLQALWYEAKGVMPLSVQQPLDALGSDEGIAQTAANTAVAFGGNTLQAPSPLEAIDREAQRKYGAAFYDLEPAQRNAVKEAMPDEWRRYVNRSSEKAQVAEDVRGRIRAQQVADDAGLITGNVTRQDWRDAYYQRQDEMRYRLSQVYGDKPITAPKNPSERYLQLIQQHTDAATGRVDWDTVSAQRAATFSASDEAFLERNTGLAATPVSRLFREAAGARREMFNLPKYRGYDADEARAIDALVVEARNNARGDDAADRLKALRRVAQGVEGRIATGARRRILGLLDETKDRERFRKAHPEIDRWFGSGKLPAKDLDLVRAATVSKAGAA